MIEGVTIIDSNIPGPTVGIIGGVHGNEPCGIIAIEEAKKKIQPNIGKIIYIFGNPRAIEKNIRYTEFNLNRAFLEEAIFPKEFAGAYERERAIELMPVLDSCDALLDLHSSGTKESPPFAIYQKPFLEIASLMPVKIRSFGWSLIDAGGTDYFMDIRGKIGLCVECGFHLDEAAPQIAFDAIKVFLHATEVSQNNKQILKYTQEEIEVFYKYKTKNNYTPTKEFKDFETITENQLLGIDGNVEIRNMFAATKILFSRRKEGPNEEAFVLGR